MKKTQSKQLYEITKQIFDGESWQIDKQYILAAGFSQVLVSLEDDLADDNTEVLGIIKVCVVDDDLTAEQPENTENLEQVQENQ